MTGDPTGRAPSVPSARTGKPGTETPCAICGRPVDPSYRPFCSARCAEIDLGRWLGERYAIPDPETGDPDGSL